MTAHTASTARVHVVGAGLAGLAAAVELTAQGGAVILHESSQQAGGRCRSFFDSELGCRIDNGNHLLLSGNTAARAYIDRIGAQHTFEPLGDAAIPFVDLADGTRWTVRPNRGRIPWWLLRPSARIPDTRPRGYAEALRLRRAGPGATVEDLLRRDTVLFRRLWKPLAVAALNTATEQGSARLFWRILAETMGRGAAACRPLLPREGLSESLVDPALAYLRGSGADIRFGARLRALEFKDARVAGLLLVDADTVTVGPEDIVILAVPAPVAARLLPGLTVPDDYAPIVNAHYRYTLPPGRPAFTGIVGGTAEWVFRKPGIVSVTVSAADHIVDLTAEELRQSLWRDVARAWNLPAAPVPAARIVKERRATFRATPVQEAKRPHPETRWVNLHLAGDYVDTGLPATIEGAIRSGFAAAARVHQGRTPATAGPPAPARPLPRNFRIARARCHENRNQG